MQWLWVIIIGFLVGVVAKWLVPAPYGFVVTTLLAVPHEISPARPEGANLFKAVLDGGSRQGLLYDAQFLNRDQESAIRFLRRRRRLRRPDPVRGGLTVVAAVPEPRLIEVLWCFPV